MTEELEVIEVVRRLVDEAGEILGSKLAMDLKVAVPDWSAEEFGARSLRDFIVSNVDGVVVAGRSGMDVVYSTSAPKDGPPARAAKAEPAADAWRAWVSPNSPFALAFNTANGKTVLIKRAAAVPEGHVRIEPTTVEEHRAIARDFLDSVAEPARDTLRAIVDSPDEQWWRRWLAELMKLGNLATWNTFRHERLRELLKARLDASGLDETARSTAAGTVAQSRPPRPRKRSHADQTCNDVRVVVAAVIEKMSEEDLRDLKLPVGLVLDVLDEMKS
ncbi:MAG: hypothetical protein RBU37_19860 [Myxococcota bacterium]|nr:hypothetical protein [Myxococcota bacterium]